MAERPAGKKRVEFSVDGALYEYAYDLHTHTVYSHGRGTIEDNVKMAVSKGLEQIGIADHGPGHIGFGVRRKNFVKMKAEIRDLQEKYPEVKILFGIEANIIAPEGRLDIKPEEYAYFDFVCAGWHYGAVDGFSPRGIASTFRNAVKSTLSKASPAQIRYNTDAIVGAIDAGGILFLTHPGDKAPVNLLEIAAACARNDTFVEINTSHMSLSADDLKMMSAEDIRFIVGSDAHTPGRIADFAPAVRLIHEAGIGFDRVVNVKKL